MRRTLIAPLLIAPLLIAPLLIALALAASLGSVSAFGLANGADHVPHPAPPSVAAPALLDAPPSVAAPPSLMPHATRRQA